MSCRRQTEHDQRNNEEHRDQVDDGKPAVACRCVAERLRQTDGKAGGRERVEKTDTGEVEQKVAESDLEGSAEAVGGWSECSEYSGRRCADVGAERQRVDTLDADDADADQRSQRRREHGTTLDQDRQDGPGQHGQVAGEEAGSAGKLGVDDGPGGGHHSTSERWIEQLNNK